MVDVSQLFVRCLCRCFSLYLTTITSPPPPRVCAVLEETDVSGGVRCSYNFGLLIQRYSRLVMQHDPRTALNYLYFARYVSVCVFVCVCLSVFVCTCVHFALLLTASSSSCCCCC